MRVDLLAAFLLRGEQMAEKRPEYRLQYQDFEPMSDEERRKRIALAFTRLQAVKIPTARSPTGIDQSGPKSPQQGPHREEHR